MEDPAAGATSYDLFFALAADLLTQGRSLILDSPVFWPIVEERSLQVARDAEAAYFMLECVCLDGGELARRLATRDALASQPRDVRNWRAAGATEPSAPRLILDTLRPLDELVEEAVTYVTAGVAR